MASGVIQPLDSQQITNYACCRRAAGIIRNRLYIKHITDYSNILKDWTIILILLENYLGQAVEGCDLYFLGLGVRYRSAFRA